MPRPKPAEPYVSMLIRFTPEQANRLRSMSVQSGTPVVEIVRQLVSTANPLPGEKQ